MKIRFKEFPAPSMGYFYSKGSSDTEYLVLGTELGSYYFLETDNNVGMLSKDLFEVIDNSQPDFWVEDNGRLVPEDWRWENFLSLNGEPYDEWDEIWFITQFAKGLEKFHLPVFPQPFVKAYETSYKVTLIKAYLKMAAHYDNLTDSYVSWDYGFIDFNRWWVHGHIKVNEKIPLTTPQINGFEKLKTILEAVGEPFEHRKIDIDVRYLDDIRNRILFTIWSIWGTKDFNVFEFKYSVFSTVDSGYLLEKDEHAFLLSFDIST